MNEEIGIRFADLGGHPEWSGNVANVLRRMFFDNPAWCDHCNHGDHLPCDLWGRDGCRCPHHDEESA